MNRFAVHLCISLGLMFTTALGGLASCGPGGDGDGNGARIDTEINTVPVIRSIVPDPTRLDAGDTTRLWIDVEDADGDPLTYAWSSDCIGSYDDPAIAEPSFALAEISGERCTLLLEVADGRGGSAEGAVTITTEPPLDPNG